MAENPSETRAVKRLQIRKRHSVGDFRERLERAMRLLLVPVSGGRHIVASVIVVPVLDRHADALLEHDRVENMVAVRRNLSAQFQPPPRMIP